MRATQEDKTVAQKDIRMLGNKELTHITWWLITFQTRKVTAYYYYFKVCQMMDIFAYRRAKKVTRKEYKEILVKIKEFQRIEKLNKKGEAHGI